MGLKIAIFTDSYLPYNSGVVHSIETLYKEVTSMGHEVFIFAPKYPNYEEKQSGVFRLKSIPTPTNRDYYLAIPLSFRIKETLKSIQPDIIHTHHPFSLGWLGMHLAKSFGLPLVYTCHTLYEFYSHYLPLPRYISRRLILRLCFNYGNRCDLIVTPSTATKDYLRQLGVNKPLRVIPTGIELEKSTLKESDWLRKRFNIKPGEKILLCVGRLGQEKNIEFLLRCFVKVIRYFPETRLVLVGQGPQEKELKRLAIGLGIRKKVIFTGLLTKEEVFKCYLGSDIFVFASVSETQGLVIPEAKSAGLPAVAVRVNGVSEMIQDGVDGFLTDLSVGKFVEKIRILLKNERLRKELSERAQINAGRFCSKKYAKDFIDLYYSLLEL